jgi:2,4-diaminopentanoate dehydrogenase
MADVINVVQCGLGPIGLGVTREIATRPNLRLVGAVDSDMRLAGQDLGALAGLSQKLGIDVDSDVESLLDRAPADVAVITTSSAAEAVARHAEPFLRNSIHVITSCEELAYPLRTRPKIAAQIDVLAKQNGVAVLATGVNPGFLMDFFPLAATAVLKRIDSLVIERIQDASGRRMPFQKKVGAGLSVAEFERQVKEGVLRHVGLTESMQMIADTLGWELERLDETIAPVLAERDYEKDATVVRAGAVLGVEQFGRGWRDGREILTLHFRATVGQENPRDALRTQGEPPLYLEIPGGVNGDIATIAIIVNAIRSIIDAEPGLRTMATAPLVVCR